MKLDLFIKEYNRVADKDMFVKSHIVESYVAYEKKIALCQKIINSAFYTEIDGKKIFRQNTPIKNELLNLTLISTYTDIELAEQPEGLLEAFNKLIEHEIIGVILSSIPEKEYIEFCGILEMMIDDLMVNERDLVGYMENKLTLLNTVLETVLPELLDKLPKEE